MGMDIAKIRPYWDWNDTIQVHVLSVIGAKIRPYWDWNSIVVAVSMLRVQC